MYLLFWKYYPDAKDFFGDNNDDVEESEMVIEIDENKAGSSKISESNKDNNGSIPLEKGGNKFSSILCHWFWYLIFHCLLYFLCLVFRNQSLF